MTSKGKTKSGPASTAETARLTSRPPKFYTALNARQRSQSSVAASVSIERVVPWWQISLLALLAVIVWNGKNLALPPFHFALPSMPQFHAANDAVNTTEATAAQQPEVAANIAPDAAPAVQLPAWSSPASQTETAIEKSYHEALDSGFMRSVLYVCHVKQTRCEVLLAIAKLESNMGRYTVNDNSSARGTMQIIRTEFLRMVETYGAQNINNLIGYLAFLPPDSREAHGLAHDIGTLQFAVNYMKRPSYHHNHALPRKMENEILRLNERPVIQLLFVADRLADDNLFLASHRGMSPEDCMRFAYLAYVHGATAADFTLAAYMNPAIRNRPVAPLLIEMYTHLYAGSPGARDWAKDTTHEILINNGQNMKTTVGEFVDTRVAPFLQLSQEYRAILEREIARGAISL